MDESTTIIKTATYNDMAKEINDLTEQVKMLAPALRCADLLRDLAVSRTANWLEIVDAIRRLDALRYP
jgi:hypothetical protein